MKKLQVSYKGRIGYVEGVAGEEVTIYFPDEEYIREFGEERGTIEVVFCNHITALGYVEV